MRTTFLAGILLLSGAVLFGQPISTPKDIVVFPLSTKGTSLPRRALSGVDAQIRNVFVNLETYRVTGTDTLLTQDEVAQLVEKLKEHTSAQPATSNEVDIGSARLSVTEMTRLHQSFMVVVPVVTSYTPKQTPSGGFTVELETSFTFIDGEKAEVVDHSSIKTIGVGPTAADAAREALHGLPRQLVYTVRALPQVHATPTIVDLGGSMVLIDVGRGSGVHVGDEFALISSRELASGRTVSERTGLLVVKEVKGSIAYAHVIYAKSRPRVGERLRRVAQIGFESSLYFHAVAATKSLGTVYSPVYTVGTLHTVTRGFYNLRPVIGFEMPIAVTSIGGSNSYSGPGLPLNVFVGAELNWRLWRFDITPVAALGVGGVIPYSTTVSLPVSVGGGLAQVTVSYLTSVKLKVFVDAGLEEWLPLAAGAFEGWGGFYGGVGLSLAY